MEYGFNIWDEGGFANGTLRTLHGEKALVDFNPNGYLPGRYWYAALFFKLFGVDILSLRLSVILFTPAMILMTYAIARKIMPAGFALLAALFMLSAPGMYYNRFYPFLCILNLFCLLNVLQRKKPKVIIYVDIVIDGKEERLLPNYAPQVYDFISRHYVFEEFIGIFQILLPKSRME